MRRRLPLLILSKAAKRCSLGQLDSIASSPRLFRAGPTPDSEKRTPDRLPKNLKPEPTDPPDIVAKVTLHSPPKKNRVWKDL